MPGRMTAFAVTLVLCCSCIALGQEAASANRQVDRPLPFPQDFAPAKYLGKWYEVARLASASQPAGTLATAEYALGGNEREIIVKNTAYDAKGKPVRTIEGKALLQEGDPPRLAVSFGPVFPEEPNYYVMHVGKEYEIAVVGNLDRNSLWILSRSPVVEDDRLEQMIKIAKDAGFNTDTLVISDWKAALADAGETGFNVNEILGDWKYVSGEKDGTELDADHFRGQRVAISKDTMTLKSDQFTFVMKYELVADSNPQAVNLEITESPFGAGQKTSGILEQSEDTLKLCYRPMGGDTPTKFEGKSGSGQHYFVLERVPQTLNAAMMIGDWEFLSGEVEGAKSEEQRLARFQVSITEDTLKLKTGDAEFQMGYRLDATKQPASLELTINKGPFGEGATAKGIAQIKGDKLYICYHPRGGEAPAEFKAGAEHSLFVLRRAPAR